MVIYLLGGPRGFRSPSDEVWGPLTGGGRGGRQGSNEVNAAVEAVREGGGNTTTR